MANVGPVVLVEVFERKIDNVVHDVSERKSQNNESAEGVLDAGRHVEAEGHAVNNRNWNVELVDRVLFELLPELPELIIFREAINSKDDKIAY